MISKRHVKDLLGELPFTAEAYWLLRQRGRPVNRAFNLERTKKHLAGWQEVASTARRSLSANDAVAGKRILLFTTLRYWIEHSVLLGMGLSGLGHRVTLAYLPYNNWQKALNRFDQRRQDLYARSVLEKAAPLMQAISFYDPEYDSLEKARESALEHPYSLPGSLARAIEAVSVRDVQYTLQVEDVDLESDLYRLRLLRNSHAARAALAWIDKQGKSVPEVILTANGSILEMGAVYAVARHLDIPAVTYEFGEQRDRIWLARNSEVMLQDTGDLWRAFQDRPLNEAEMEKIRTLFASRQSANLWANFSRQWQGQPIQGSEKTRQALNLDQRPIALLAANVIGDSLTLGRQVFSQSMTEWLERTLAYFKERPDVQLVVRIHPGERYTKGPSVANIVRKVFSADAACPKDTPCPPDALCPPLPEHVHLVEAADPTNTYDIAGIADLGLVYTTTTGMEMAMLGLRVIAAGQTHYRGKGFTLDPETWDEYFAMIDQALAHREGRTLSPEAGKRAWSYAYRFFFNYPLPFPWHLLRFWDELPRHPLEQVLSPEGQEQYREAFDCLAGVERRYETGSELTEAAGSGQPVDSEIFSTLIPQINEEPVLNVVQEAE
jgi:hypothetical protein